MAMAGHADVLVRDLRDDATSQGIAWRSVAKHLYYATLAGASVALLVFSRPSFDHSVPTLASVAVIAAFLAITERPQRAVGTAMAPMTSVLAVCTVLFGYWALPIAAIGWGAVFFRRDGHSIRAAFSSSVLGQLGATTISVYAMIAVWRSIHGLADHVAIPALSALIVLLGIVAVGLTVQTVTNTLVAIACAIVGTRFHFGQLARTGVLASLWAYFLIGLYSFGGILAMALFYVIVAHTRMFSGIMGVIEAIDKNERSAGQAHGLLTRLMTLTDSPQVEFTKDVAYIATLLGRNLDLPKAEMDNLKLAAQLHEVGLCLVPAAVRRGAGLTPAQAQVRARYPYLGGKLLHDADAIIPSEVADAVELHREHFDGTGYPRGFKGGRIPLAARIIPIAADYVRLLTGYGGTTPVPKGQALEQLRASAGVVYDPSLVDLLCRVT
jgi:hypothetical protein